MAKLMNVTKHQQLLGNLKVVGFGTGGGKGLIGTTYLDPDSGLMIQQCGWIHTFFMSIPIDVIYLSKSMKVTKLQLNLKPWRLPAPVLTAASVVEVASGVVSRLAIEVGDQLHVGD